ncbi:hypothetical protein NM688_g8754 [Phlebia brevispora]|uniref:Uncharacterized protein n=1 Tax=Phlebia brevispora TaxID=194682 RepID=A0ACC1RQ71_9APHY|nr:hypothetical protein NM688_g8754 [Phlebia brevispora]
MRSATLRIGMGALVRYQLARKLSVGFALSRGVRPGQYASEIMRTRLPGRLDTAASNLMGYRESSLLATTLAETAGNGPQGRMLLPSRRCALMDWHGSRIEMPEEWPGGKSCEPHAEAEKPSSTAIYRSPEGGGVLVTELAATYHPCINSVQDIGRLNFSAHMGQPVILMGVTSSLEISPSYLDHTHKQLEPCCTTYLRFTTEGASGTPRIAPGLLLSIKARPSTHYAART